MRPLSRSNETTVAKHNSTSSRTKRLRLDTFLLKDPSKNMFCGFKIAFENRHLEGYRGINQFTRRDRCLLGARWARFMVSPNRSLTGQRGSLASWITRILASVRNVGSTRRSASCQNLLWEYIINSWPNFHAIRLNLG